MSVELKPVEDRNGRVNLTQFYGGSNDGRCIQITSFTQPYISLTKMQATVLAYALLGWTQGNYPEETEND